MIKIRPAILIKENDKILTMQYRYGNEDVFNLPGGNLEFGEKMVDALKREMEEELGIEVRVGSLILIGEIHFPEQKKHSLHCIFEGKIMAGTPTLNPEHTSAQNIRWLALHELPSLNLYPNVSKNLILWQNQSLESPYIGKINQQWF
jgi:8-oxo-dGTP diphosphatase